MRTEIYKTVTNQIIEALRAGVRPWESDMKNPKAILPLRSCGEAYKGINVLILQMASMAKGFSSPYWLTFKQAKDLGANVKKGEKSTEIIFYKTLMINDDETDEKKKVPMLRTYRVFNCDQIENLAEDFDPAELGDLSGNGDDDLKVLPITEIDDFFARIGARVETQNTTPHFSPLHNRIVIPDMNLFKNEQLYYSVLGHEHVHWTGHKSRLDRDFSGRMKGSKKQKQSYAFEELIAEIGASFLMPSLGLNSLVDSSHAPYISGYLEVLENDEKAIFKAAAAAQKAVDLLFELSEKEEVKAA